MKALAAALLCSAAASALAASFDCAKATRPTERAVCADAELSDLDEVLARYYQGALLALKENATCLKADQARWLRVVRNTCGGAACLKYAYLARLSELHALQPGINTQRKLALPAGPSLAWAVAPEPDRIASPRIASRPFTAEGKLTYRGDMDSGYFLEASAAERYLLVPDMMLHGSTATALPTLAKLHSEGRMRARGQIARDNRGKPFFDRRHCLFLHRLP